MRESCAVNDKTVTRYFDIYCNVIIHWYAYHTVEEVFKENETMVRLGDRGLRQRDKESSIDMRG